MNAFLTMPKDQEPLYFDIFKTLKKHQLTLAQCHSTLQACANDIMGYVNSRDFQLPESNEEELER